MTGSIAKVIVLTGKFGGGKTRTAVSFVPSNWDGKSQVNRLMIDPEIRASSYQSLDGKDHPEKHLFNFTSVNGSGRVTGKMIESIFNKVRYAGRVEGIEWKNGPPSVIIFDDAAMCQDILVPYWGIRENAISTAHIYGLDATLSALTAKTWKPKDPGTITNVYKRLIEEFILDCRTQGITVIATSPLHNLWLNYGSTGYDQSGKPLMRIKGQSVKIWDVWLRNADVIWDMDIRKAGVDDRMTFIPRPHVRMDPFNPKFSFPGLPVEFDWPEKGWSEIWAMHLERRYETKLEDIKQPEPEFSPEAMAEVAQTQRLRLYKELPQFKVDDIRALMEEEGAPDYSFENHDDYKAWIVRTLSERTEEVK